LIVNIQNLDEAFGTNSEFGSLASGFDNVVQGTNVNVVCAEEFQTYRQEFQSKYNTWGVRQMKLTTGGVLVII